VKRALSFALALLVVLCAPALAQQQQRPGRGVQPAGAARQAQPPQGQPSREPGWQNRQAPQPHHGRMSDEDRRQLRRDISDHGRDIYRERPGQKRP
jgi:hypothetical protein